MFVTILELGREGTEWDASGFKWKTDFGSQLVPPLRMPQKQASSRGRAPEKKNRDSFSVEMSNDLLDHVGRKEEACHHVVIPIC